MYIRDLHKLIEVPRVAKSNASTQREKDRGLYYTITFQRVMSFFLFRIQPLALFTTGRNCFRINSTRSLPNVYFMY